MYFQLLVLAGLIYDTFSFVILPAKVLISTRLDPIVKPGVSFGHVHDVFGGNMFNATYSVEFSQLATCTTSPIDVDKSAYWTSAMYFMNKTTNPMTYKRVDSSFNISYFPRSDSGNVIAFPPNFRMVAGNATSNTYNASSFGEQAVSWVCLDHSNPESGLQPTPGFPTTNCPDGIKAQIFFPSCWDNATLGPDIANHIPNVLYPIGGYNSGGNCPSTYPVKLVSLLYEQIFDTSGFNVNEDGETWILSSGDVTGYSYHADFWNGWDSSVLQSVIEHCNADTGDGNMHDCPPLKPHINETARDACQLDPSIRIPEEDVGLFDSIPALPGDNSVWLAGQDRPVNSSYRENASWGHVGSLDEGVGLIGTRPISFNTITGVHVDDTDVRNWKSRGCIADSITGRALEGVVVTDEPEMNLRKCALLCESRGYSIAGLEFGHECYCDNSLRNGAHMDRVGDVNCGIPCTGNPYENCGGSGYLVILTKDGASSAQVHRSHSYFVLLLSLMIMFLMALL